MKGRKKSLRTPNQRRYRHRLSDLEPTGFQVQINSSGLDRKGHVKMGFPQTSLESIGYLQVVKLCLLRNTLEIKKVIQLSTPQLGSPCRTGDFYLWYGSMRKSG